MSTSGWSYYKEKCIQDFVGERDHLEDPGLDGIMILI